MRKRQFASLCVLLLLLCGSQLNLHAEALTPPATIKFSSTEELETMMGAADLPADEFEAYVEKLKENGVNTYGLIQPWVIGMKKLFLQVGYPVVEDETMIESCHITYYPQGHNACVYDIRYQIDDIKYHFICFPFEEGGFANYAASRFITTADLGANPMQLYKCTVLLPSVRVYLSGQWRLEDYLISLQIESVTDKTGSDFIDDISLAPFRWSREITPTAPDYRIIQILCISAGVIMLLAGTAAAWLLIRHRKRRSTQI